ncbi:MAG: HEAT repeat domain-containing protein [Pseudoruegeria sp.]
MKYKSGIAAFFLTSSLIVAETEDQSMECAVLNGPDFFIDMLYLASNSERCVGHCGSGDARVGDEVAIKILENHLTHDQHDRVKDSVIWALSLISQEIGSARSISLLDSVDGEYQSKIIIFPITDELDRVLVKQGLPGLSAMEYVFPHRAVLIDGGCSARFFVTGKENEEIISLAYVFASSQSLEDQHDLDLCILEEVTQVFGLFGDPPDSASLFDGGNIDLSEMRPRHSPKTNAMLKYLYSGKTMDEASFQKYKDQVCKINEY